MGRTEHRWGEQEAADLVRSRVIAGIHGGHLRPGDRLPTYREVAAETRLDLRAVGRIYRTLEVEGLVEVRGRSGVFVAKQERIGGEVLAETARWMVSVLCEAWMRRIPVRRFADFATRCIASRQIRCACIESTEDQLVWLCRELEEEFGVVPLPVHADRLSRVRVEDRFAERVPPEVSEADLLVTTTFHGPSLHSLAQALEKPLVVLKINPVMVRQVQNVLAERELTVIVLDPAMLERLRLVVGPEHAGRIRGVLASDRQTLARLDSTRPVLISRPARERLNDLDLPPRLALGPAISPASIEELIAALIRLNVESLEPGG